MEGGSVRDMRKTRGEGRVVGTGKGKGDKRGGSSGMIAAQRYAERGRYLVKGAEEEGVGVKIGRVEGREGGGSAGLVLTMMRG